MEKTNHKKYILSGSIFSIKLKSSSILFKLESIMLNNEEKLWQVLSNFEITRLEYKILKKNHTIEEALFKTKNNIVFEKPMEINKGDIVRNFEAAKNDFLILSKNYNFFVEGINEVMAIYSEIVKLRDLNDLFNPKNLFFFNQIQSRLINALEVYLRELFKDVASMRRVSELNFKVVNKFLKIFQLNKRFEEIYRSNGNLEFLLSDILPERLDFQKKDNVRIAYSFIRFNVVDIMDGLWSRIYSKTEGYINKRHIVIHSKPKSTSIINIKDFDLNKEIEYLEKEIIDIVQFIFYIETQRLFYYPDKWEIEIIKKFPMNKIDTNIKKKIIEINTEILNWYAQDFQRKGQIKISNQFKHMLREYQKNN